MSTNSNGGDGGAGAGGAQQAPRLLVGGYAAWRPLMEAFLQRTGAEGIHSTPMTDVRWTELSGKAAAWAEEALAAAMALVLGDGGAMDDDAAVKEERLSEAHKAARKLVTALVERSRKAYGALFSALPEELRAQVAHIPAGFAHGLWRWLETKFQSTEQDSVGELLAQWTSLAQEEGETFDAYRARVNKLNTLLDQAKEKPSARMFAFILLDRLQPRYKAAVLALKAGGQLKDAAAIAWDTVTALINAHERDELRLDGETSSSSGSGAEGKAMATRAWNNAPRGRGAAYGGAQANEGAQRGAQQEGAGGHSRSHGQVQCWRCSDLGHIARFCPKKGGGAGHGSRAPGGAPAGGAEGAREQASAVLSANRFAALDAEPQGESLPALRPAEYSYAVRSWAQAAQGLGVEPEEQRAMVTTEERKVSLQKLVDEKLRKATKEKRDAAAAGAAPAAAKAAPVAKAAQAAPKEKHAAVPAAQAVQPKPVAVAEARKQNGVGVNPDKALAEDAWGVDTMASLNVSGNRALFRNLRRCAPVTVQVADGSTVVVEQFGNVELRVSGSNGKTVRLQVQDVYFHERFKVNLLSWNVLRAKGWEFHSAQDQSYVTTPGNNKLMLSTRGRVSVLNGAPADRVYGITNVNGGNVAALVRAHEVLGHMAWSSMKPLIKNGELRDMIKCDASEQEIKEAQLLIMDCEGCIMAKGTRTPFGKSGIDKGSAPGETLHMDTFQVPMVAPGAPEDGTAPVHHLEYGVTVTDPYSGSRWFISAVSKDQIAKQIRDVVVGAEQQLQCKVKRLYADGGTEFINQTIKKFCAEKGVELHYPPARTQQLNGVAENAVRSVKDVTRTLLCVSGAPQRFWTYAARHANFLWNRTHVSAVTGKTPYETTRGQKPSARHWGVFGCDALHHLPKEQRGPLAPKCEPCIYLGHDAKQNCASVFVLRTGKVIATRDVRYRAGSFTHMAALKAGQTRVGEMLAQDVREEDFRGAEEEEEEEAARAESKEEIEEREVTAAEASNKYEVERILKQRETKAGVDYRVLWNSGEETWEPAERMQEDAPDIIHDYLEAQATAAAAANAQPAHVRRSPRFAQDAEDEDAAQQVHLVMSAMRDMEPADESVAQDREAQVNAVSAGIALLEQRTPANYREAMAGPDAPKWRGATDKEMDSMDKKKVIKLVQRADMPRGHKALPCKFVLKIKTDSDGKATEFKARLTPQGFRQKEGVDYFEVYARTGMYKSMRCGLSLTARWDHELDQMDVPTAYLNADLDEEIYMELPEGYREGNEDKVCRLLKSLYGLKQSGRNWYLLFSKFITSLGFKASVSDPCLFYRRSKTGRLMLLFLFVDDVQVSYHREDKAEWEALKARFVARFQTKDMGTSEWILGMRIVRNRVARTITLDQELYVTKALEKYGLAECKVADTPEVVGAAHAEPTEQERAPTDKQRYMEITGTLMYAAISTRLDIAHAVHHLASNMLAPTEKHMAAATRVLRYLAGTKEVGLVFGARNGTGAEGDSRGRGEQQLVDICAFADADWANNKGDRKSITGWAAKLNGDPVSWTSKKQRTVALSTCEAELYAEAAAIQEVLWLRGLLSELGLHARTGSLVYGDNQSAIAVSKNGIKGERTKHVDIKYHFVTETVEAGDVRLKWIPTTEQQADIFTKALSAPVFHQLRRQLMTR